MRILDPPEKKTGSGYSFFENYKIKFVNTFKRNVKRKLILCQD